MYHKQYRLQNFFRIFDVDSEIIIEFLLLLLFENVLILLLLIFVKFLYLNLLKIIFFLFFIKSVKLLIVLRCCLRCCFITPA